MGSEPLHQFWDKRILTQSSGQEHSNRGWSVGKELCLLIAAQGPNARHGLSIWSKS